MWYTLLLIGFVLIHAYLAIKAIIRHRKHEADGMLWYKERLDEFSADLTKQSQKRIDEKLVEFKESYIERLNLLSKENARLIETNEHLRGKLKNLGFTDKSIDL